MEYIQLGASDLKVSRICLGCMGFGDAAKGMHSWTLPYDKSKEIIAYALEKASISLIQRWPIRAGRARNILVGP